jgi:hypothetical protein
LQKKDGSDDRPPGRLAQAALAYGSLALAAREARARRGAGLVRDAEATGLGRFALPMVGPTATLSKACGV